VARKVRKKPKKAAGTTNLVLGLVVGAAVLLIGAAVALAWVFWPGESQTTPVAATTPPRVAPAGPGPAPAQETAAVAPADTASEPTSAGRRVFEANRCGRCHAVGGAAAAGGQRGGRNRGPDLATVGRDPEHTVSWLMDHVRNPHSHKPDSQMPTFEGKINDDDLRALAEYLASLK
jgi:mono/diheme cytochrome c family protein